MVIQWCDDSPMVILLSHPCSSHWSQSRYMALRCHVAVGNSQNLRISNLDVESPDIEWSTILFQFLVNQNRKKAHDFKTRKKPCSICWTAAYCCHVAGATTGWRTHPTGFVGNPGGQEWCTWADSTQKWPRILEPTLETKIQPVSATIRIWTPLQRFTCATICH